MSRCQLTTRFPKRRNSRAISGTSRTKDYPRRGGPELVPKRLHLYAGIGDYRMDGHVYTFIRKFGMLKHIKEPVPLLNASRKPKSQDLFYKHLKLVGSYRDSIQSVYIDTSFNKYGRLVSKLKRICFLRGIKYDHFSIGFFIYLHSKKDYGISEFLKDTGLSFEKDV